MIQLVCEHVPLHSVQWERRLRVCTGCDCRYYILFNMWFLSLFLNVQSIVALHAHRRQKFQPCGSACGLCTCSVLMLVAPRYISLPYSSCTGTVQYSHNTKIAHEKIPSLLYSYRYCLFKISLFCWVHSSRKITPRSKAKQKQKRKKIKNSSLK